MANSATGRRLLNAQFLPPSVEDWRSRASWIPETTGVDSSPTARPIAGDPIAPDNLVTARTGQRLTIVLQIDQSRLPCWADVRLQASPLAAATRAA